MCCMGQKQHPYNRFMFAQFWQRLSLYITEMGLVVLQPTSFFYMVHKLLKNKYIRKLNSIVLHVLVYVVSFMASNTSVWYTTTEGE